MLEDLEDQNPEVAALIDFRDEVGAEEIDSIQSDF
jgi:hypothetical protein